MKTKKRINTSVGLLTLMLVMTSTTVLAYTDNPDTYAEGTSPVAGNYTIKVTENVYHYMGEVYKVYDVNYEVSSMDINIAMNNNGKKKSFIAYTDDYIIFYTCGKKGFGAEKFMFSGPSALLTFNPNEILEQKVLSEKRNISTHDAIELIAASLPSMRQSL